MKLSEPLALCHPRRTPFAQIGKALGAYPSHHLGLITARDIMNGTGLRGEDTDAVIVGEGFPFAPNSARVIANLLGMPDHIPAVTINQNCVSSLEALANAGRRLILEEGQLILCLGEESQTSMPMVIAGARLNKKTASLDKLKKALAEGLPDGVEIRDTLEDGLGDGETSYGMHITAELIAQNYGLSRALLDEFALKSFQRAYAASTEGRYAPFIIPVEDDKGGMLEADEAVLLRKGIVENPNRMQRAMLLFDNPHMKWDEFKSRYGSDLEKTGDPTTSIFNACPRSDGAAGVILAKKQRASELDLQVDALLSGWHFKGVHPNRMGIGQAAATLALLDDMGLKFEDIDRIEIHEAFAATAVGALEEMRLRSGFDWKAAFDAGKINPNGGSIAIGHPFGATGLRLVANAVMGMRENPDVKRTLITACAHGGIAGALMLERP